MRYQSSMKREELQLNCRMFSAAGDGDLREVEAALRLGASLDFVFEDEYSETPLHEAIYYDRLAVAGFLIREQKKRDDADAEELREMSDAGGAILNADSELGTPLHIAVSAGNLRAVRLLLKAGARPDKVGYEGNTPIHVAAKAGDVVALRALITELESIAGEGGIFPGEEYAALELEDCEGNTALHLAAGEGHEATVAQLLSYSSNVGSVNSEDETALAVAVVNERLAIAKRLLKARADPHGPKGRSLVGTATRLGNVKLVRLLLEYGADPQADCDGAPPIRFAIAQKNSEIERLLRAAGGDERRRPTRRPNRRKVRGPRKSR